MRTRSPASSPRCRAAKRQRLLPSTLHLFWDLFRVLDGEQTGSCTMPDSIRSRGGAWNGRRGSACRSAPFAHHDAAALARLIGRMARAKLRPIVVADGFCPSCGAPAPIRAYAELARRAGGYLVLDDTQALGILGEQPSDSNPYGTGGGGSLRWHGVFGPHIIVGSSLAKGFGVPLAALSGSRALIERFREHSETRIHCSPPSVAAIHAAHRRCGLTGAMARRCAGGCSTSCSGSGSG